MMDIAIIGVACKFPCASNIDEFWGNLVSKMFCISEVPGSRWCWEEYWGDPKKERNKSLSKWGGFIEDVDKFDASFFGLLPKVISSMDPQQRISLELAWECIENSGYAPSRLRGSKTGVFCGVFNHDYKELQERQDIDIEAHHSTGTASSIIANRISHFFDFKGPSFPIDTACSSSLNAVHSAIQAIEFGDCDLAIAGGVNLILTPTRHISFSKMGMLSPTGRCNTFDDSADGYVRGEGAGFIMLKPLDKALKDGDFIQGVIKGSAVNHCGETYTLTYPSAEVQADVICEAHRRAGVSLSTIKFIETHGTGTPKGDPIEVEGLVRAYSKLAKEQHLNYKELECYLGAVKTNIGHLEAAAGIAGIVKVLASFRHKTLAPLQNFQTQNSRFSLKDTPFKILKDSMKWPLNHKDRKVIPMRAGVSSFGFGGTNAHVVLEQPPEVKKLKKVSQAHYLILLSAKTVKSLQKYKIKLKKWIERSGRSYRLIDISAGLIAGRDHFNFRSAYIVGSYEELLEKLTADIDGEERGYTSISSNDEDKRNKAQESADLVIDRIVKASTEKPNLSVELSVLISHYYEGASAGFDRLFSKYRIQRIPLPSYVFDRQSYWLDFQESDAYGPGETLHPLVHKNTSSLDEQKYTSVFSGREFFLKDHIVQGKKVLPAAAYLEMSIDAIMRANEIESDDPVILELHDVYFMRPFVSNKNRNGISVKIFPMQKPSAFPEIVSCMSLEMVSEHEKSLEEKNFQGSAYIRNELKIIEPIFIEWTEKGFYGENDFYAFMENKGFNYGKSLRTIKRYSFDGRRALVELNLSEFGDNAISQFRMHPSILDGALQGAVALLSGLTEDNRSKKTVLPFSIDEVAVSGCLGPACYALIQSQENSNNLSNTKTDILIFNENPIDKTISAIVSIKGLNCREFVAESVGMEYVSKNYALKKDVRYLKTENNSYYSPSWQSMPINFPASKNEIFNLLIVGDDDMVEACASSLSKSRRFSDVSLIKLCIGSQYKEISTNHYTVRSCGAEEIDTVFRRLIDLKMLPEKILFLHGATDISVVNDEKFSEITKTAEQMFALVKSAFRPIRRVRIVSLVEGDYLHGQPLVQALSGFYKTVKLEKPTYQGRIVLLDSLNFNSNQVVEIVSGELNSDDSYVDVAYSNNVRYVREFYSFNDYSRLVSHPENTKVTGFRRSGVYLITGGMGALGFLVAKYMIEEYQAIVYLTGRSELKEDKLLALKDLCKEGADVHYLRGDVGDIAVAKQWIDEIRTAGKSLNGILHSAGVIEDNFIIKKDISSFQRVIGPKVKGTLALDIATQNEPLDIFLLFSSVTGIFGNLGQCDYGYGNSFEDYFSRYRNGLEKKGDRSGHTVSINWPYWKEGGMQLNDKEEEILFKNFGITPLGNIDGLKAMEFAVQNGIPQMAVLEGDEVRVAEVLGVRPLQDPLDKDVQGNANTNSSQSFNVTKEQVFDYLTEVFSKELKIPKERFDLTSSFQEFGFDSVVMIDMVNLLENKFEGLPRTIFFEYQNLNDLSDYILSEYGSKMVDGFGDSKSTIPSKETLSESPRKLPRFNSQLVFNSSVNSEENEIAIVGISGRFPGAENVEQFWTNLKEGKDCITEVPLERGWEIETIFTKGSPKTGTSYSKWGGFLKDFDKFDPLFFNISPKDAEEMDPHVRLFLETSCLAIADAGYRPDKLVPSQGSDDSSVGVYAGVMWGDYHLYGIEGSSPSTLGTPHSYHWAIANRVSYHFNFSGPSITIDTACSSSITAMHLAIDALRKGEIDAAIAGGVNLSLHPAKYTLLSNQRFLSTDGRCRSFGVGGDGYVPAEAVGAVILKRRSEAERDGDHIYGIIKSTAINHGGRNSGFTVPNPNRQAALIRKAIKTAKIDPRDISYVEAHGTGTSLGDPIEIAGLAKAFEQTETQYCPMGSAKSNIGHAESAAGVAGLIKILLQMKHQQIAPSLHSSELNPHTKIESSPFVIQQTLGKWSVDKGNKRLAALSAFGAGGANGHLIVEEYIPETEVESEENRPHLILLSAGKESSLRLLASEMAAHLQVEKSLTITQVAYTLQVGRSPLSIGCAIIVNSMEELIKGLNVWAQGDTISSGWWGKRGGRKQQEAVRNDTRQIGKYIREKNLDALAESWMNGNDIPWEELYDRKVMRASLPGYVFDKSRYWIDHLPLGNKSPIVEKLSPLIDKNVSTFDEQLFEKASKLMNSI